MPLDSITRVAVEFDLLVDLADSELDPINVTRHIDELRVRGGLDSPRCRITVASSSAVVSGTDAPGTTLLVQPSEALGHAIRSAAVADRSLLVIRGAWVPDPGVGPALIDLARLDPMVGTVQPRISDPIDDSIACLTGGDTGGGTRMRKEVLNYLPASMLTTELSAALFLISSPGVLASDVSATPRAFDEALSVLLIGLRRKGFRNLVTNRVVVPFPLDHRLCYPELSLPVTETKHPWSDDVLRTRRWSANTPLPRLESIWAGAFGSDGRPRVLIDCRALPEMHNGTAHAMVGIINGFAQLSSPPFDIVIWVGDAAARFHGLASHSEYLTFVSESPRNTFAAAFVPHQPWSIESLKELHGIATILVFYMHDTIAWDIVFAAPDQLDQLWRVIGRLADGLAFNSEYSRKRFGFRFAINSEIETEVAYPALMLDDLRPVTGASDDIRVSHILVFGNHYDHKGVGPAVGLLRDAFPFTPMVVVGDAETRGQNFVSKKSGQICGEEIEALYAAASVVVYPSFYEGFGMPVFEALARGKIVVVRRSPLWHEIIGHTMLPGRLVEFRNEHELVAAVGGAIHGTHFQALPQGGLLAPGEAPPGWRACAEGIMHLLKRLMLTGNWERWLTRDSLLGTSNSS